jgi:tRNA(fMet)-specific endonuclease VapC
VKNILLDTNAYVSFLTGDEHLLKELSIADVVYFSIFVLGELYAGFRGGTKYQENRNILEKFLQKPTVEILNATEVTSDIFGQLKNTLKKAGTPLPINDVWIASHALETGSKLISYDKHFAKCPGVRLWECGSSDL